MYEIKCNNSLPIRLHVLSIFESTSLPKVPVKEFLLPVQETVRIGFHQPTLQAVRLERDVVRPRAPMIFKLIYKTRTIVKVRW